MSTEIERPTVTEARQLFELWWEDSLSIEDRERVGDDVILRSLLERAWVAGSDWLWLGHMQPHLDNLSEREREADAQASSRMLARLDDAITLRGAHDQDDADAIATVREEFDTHTDSSLLNAERGKVRLLKALLDKARTEIDRLEAGLPAVAE
jgi:hypothetical protein